MRKRCDLFAASLAVVLACRGGPVRTAPAPAESPADAAPTVIDAVPPEPDLPTMRFDAACVEGERAVVAAVGDVLLHHELQKQAVAHPTRFRVLWAGVADLLAGADTTYANLEGVIAPGLAPNARKTKDPGPAFDGVVYTGYPRFNYHPSVADDLRDDGVDVVSTANNHTFDRDHEGIDTTIDALRAARLAYAGTRRGDEGRKGGTAVTRAGALRIGWIACAAFTNRFKDDPTPQIIRCGDETLELVRRLSRDTSIDAVIVTPHWGRSYVHEPTHEQVTLARAWLDAGASVVFGGHPHVLQPWERYTTRDGRQTFIVYSLGNFVSHQPELPRRSTAIVYVGFTRDAAGVTRVNGARFVPVHVRQDGEEFFAEAIDRVGGPTDAREHITSILPAGNALRPDAPLVTNSECD